MILPAGMHFLPIPDLFWSAYLEQPFEHCIDCGCLLKNSAVYVIQKRFVAGEAVFEMAICDVCRQRLTDSYSQETKEALSRKMTEYFQRNAALLSNPSTAASSAEELLDRTMNYCLMCGIARKDCRKYSLAGLFRADQIIVYCGSGGQSPVLICETCEEGLAGLISKKTRDAWDRFVEEHFDGPPGIDLDIPTEHPIAF